MALLEKLQIQGIRSFGSESNQTPICFGTPFTLILGRNGCGKTTIIESLKYACTGTLPVGQGANFVRDPKIDRLLETFAQVKLKMKNVLGKEIIVTRSLQATLKAKKIEVKTVDSTVNADGQQISSRCANLDEYMAVALGVSKPILNYVIFCHQEDSFWPLDENKKVKERFDDIFDATKYNKCINQMRDLRKNILADVKTRKETLKYKEDYLRTAQKKEKELHAMLKNQEQKKKTLQDLMDKIVALDQEYQECMKDYNSYTDLDHKKGVKEGELNENKKCQAQIRGAISVLFTGTREELEDVIADFSSQLRSKKSAHERISQQITTSEVEESAAQQSISAVTQKVGQLENQERAETEKKNERNAKVNRLAQSFGFSILQSNAGELQIDDLIKKINQSLQKMAQDKEALRREQEEEQNMLQAERNSCLEVKTKLESEVEIKKNAIFTNKSDLSDLKEKLSKVDSSASRLQRLEAQLSRYQVECEEAKKLENPDTLSREIETHRDTCKRLEERQKELNEELRSLKNFMSDQKTLEMKEQKQTELQTNIRKIRSKYEDSITRLLKNSTDSSIKSDLDKLMDKLKKDIQMLNQQLSSKEREISSLEQDRKHKKSEVGKKEAELNKTKEALYELCGRQEYDVVLQKVQSDLKKLQDDKGAVQSAGLIYKKYIEKLRVPEPCCPLCHRGFHNEQEIGDLVDELETKAESFPSIKNELTNQVSAMESKLHKMLQFQPAHERSGELRQEITLLKDELESVEERLDTAQQDVIIVQGSLTVPQEDLKAAESMRSEVYVIDCTQKELRTIQREIENFKARLPSAVGSRSFDDAMAEQQIILDELSSVRAEKDTTEQRLRDYTERVNALEKKVNQTVAEQLKIKEMVQERGQLITRIQELELLDSTFESELQALEQRLAPAEENLKVADDNLDATKREHRRTIDKKNEEIQQRGVDLDRVNNLHKTVKDFISKSTVRILAEKRKEQEELNEKFSNIKEQTEKLRNKANQLSKEIEGHKGRETELQQNLVLMQKVEETKKLQLEVEKLKRDLSSVNYREVREKCHAALAKCEETGKEKYMLEGELKQLEETVKAAQAELERPELKYAEERHKDHLVSLAVRQEVEKDLQKYQKAFDYAMQHFHRDRMATINKIIRELWRLIYKGNDIDFIEIKTDEQAVTTTAYEGPDKRKNYNYRVVQVKNGTEIEMRGRCSAGQKVLASLIIRMALAETFSSNCGILTLDEPTTNLDQQNICSLSDAVVEIVREHTGRKNFQLIVITHDHNFLERLSNADFLSHYWEVTRDHNSKSKVRKVSLKL